MGVNDRMQSFLEKRKSENALRELKVVKDKVDFCSNDYLGFAQNKEIIQFLSEKISDLRKTGSTGSRLLTGNYSLIEKVEQEIAAFHHAPAALFFNSGYEANSGLISTVVSRHDTIIYDALCHASLREGIKLSGARSVSFPHSDVTALEEKLSASEGEIFIIVESVYSMDGDISPLQDIVRLAEKYHASVILDEAHGTGVIGEKGEGLAQHLGVEEKIFARVHTFGKAIGNNGAVILGSVLLRQYLINFCKPFIYTTATNYLQVLAVQKAYQLLSEKTPEIGQLQHNIQYFGRQVRKFKQIQLLPSDSAIFSVLIPGHANVKLAATYLQNGGCDVRPILSPTVPAGSERLRICLHSFNTETEIDRLVKLLDQITEVIGRDTSDQ